MSTILLVVHLMIALAMIVLVLLQRSEGGALGIGGGGSGDGLMSGRGLGNALTRTTGILAGLFFLTSIGLTVLGTMENRSSVLDGVDPNDSNPLEAPAPASACSCGSGPGVTHTGIIICPFEAGESIFRLARIMACVYSVIPWRVIYSSPAAWFLLSAKGWHRPHLGHCFRRAAIPFASANLTLISM